MADQGFLKPTPGFATTAIHAGQSSDKWKSAAVVPPIVMSTTFKQTPEGHTGYIYGRSGNPTRHTLEECLAGIEGAKYACVYSSGLGATTTICSLLEAGNHILSMDDGYGGTHRLLSQVVTRMGIEVSFTDFTKLENLGKNIRKNTKMIWMESPTNPSLKVVDIAAVVKIAKSLGDILVAVDNTFLTCYLQKPLDFGADIVMYSMTKYMNGHSDVVMGAAVVNDAKLAERLKFLQKAMGAVPSPFDCYLVNRSLKTLALRMERHKASSLAIAQWLSKHPNVTEVMHPGLPSHPQYEISKRQTAGHSGIVSFIHTGGLKESKKFMSSLKVFILAESLGGYESLIELPSLMTHASVPAEQRAELGISDALLRLTVGLEDVEDLIKDLEQAFKETF
ncbi:hypothetical protein B5X24_HaOG207166 [Helicoverpa armigera]|uniref:cystathionine gamma-lyase n=1 Tax=Helicoverpa armigera TaxID=29058 RepID=A0A2W1BSU2_HELAM|nr:hypothetical protein B5X24_HaOG207166 [Helicoverpa armigera]